MANRVFSCLCQCTWGVSVRCRDNEEWDDNWLFLVISNLHWFIFIFITFIRHKFYTRIRNCGVGNTFLRTKNGYIFAMNLNINKLCQHTFKLSLKDFCWLYFPFLKVCEKITIYFFYYNGFQFPEDDQYGRKLGKINCNFFTNWLND